MFDWLFKKKDEEVELPKDLQDWANSDPIILWYLYDCNLMPEQIRTIKQVCALRGFQFGWKCRILAAEHALAADASQDASQSDKS